MNANSVGLEVEVYMSKCEIEKLKNSTIESTLKFREIFENKRREIPIRIMYDESQRELLEVVSIPGGCYFSDANLVIFMINKQFYEQLSGSGSYGDRFFVSGKLSIYAENIK